MTSLGRRKKSFSLSKLSMEERIIQKNIKTLLYEAEHLEPLSFTIKNKNMVLEIFNMIQQLMEKMQAAKRFAAGNYDWTS